MQDNQNVELNDGDVFTVTWKEFVDANRESFTDKQIDSIESTLDQGKVYAESGGASISFSLKKQ
tara:strand:+ start:347 stop:538 length:192 start_codon:yes stop_codon:yes gene_type:complete